MVGSRVTAFGGLAERTDGVLVGITVGEVDGCMLRLEDDGFKEGLLDGISDGIFEN